VRQSFFENSRANRPLAQERSDVGISANRYGRRWNRRDCGLGLRPNFRIHIPPKHYAGADHDSWNHGTRVDHYTWHHAARHCVTDPGHSHADSRDG
jgi:hypothetical protein